MSYDVLVIGAGSGGLSTATSAANYGAKVAIVESNYLGGTCVNRGCIPKKLMIQAADFVEQQTVARSFCWSNVEGSFDWAAFKSTMHQHLDDLRQSQQESLQDAGVDIVRGTAQFIDGYQVQVGDQILDAEHTVIAVGGSPTVPDIPGSEFALTSKDMFHLPQLPQHIGIVGGGYIGIEFSHIFARLGVKVTLIDTSQQVLSGFDDSLRTIAHAGLERLGVTFIPQKTCSEIVADGSQRVMTLSSKDEDDEAQTVSTDMVLMAVGRSPNLEALNLEKAGVDLKDGNIAVDDYGQTSQPSIYAVGDCIGRLPLTPAAIAEGEAVAKTICCKQPTATDYRWIPSAVFGVPPLATVGWSEAEAKQQLGDDLETYEQRFVPLHHSLMQNAQNALIKWLACQSTGQIVGVHAAGNEAPDMIQGLIPALQKGLTLAELKLVSGIHPTSGEELFVVPKE
ncbi:FAD-dependent oxidoreductase [Oscillatoria sp. CS-180]|nr:FAD-dependent oxidoreductase [Oscillatoria sp. CS-180]